MTGTASYRRRNVAKVGESIPHRRIHNQTLRKILSYSRVQGSISKASQRVYPSVLQTPDLDWTRSLSHRELRSVRRSRLLSLGSGPTRANTVLQYGLPRRCEPQLDLPSSLGLYGVNRRCPRLGICGLWR